MTKKNNVDPGQARERKRDERAKKRKGDMSV
jgi:hypothetical protein